MTTDDLRLLQRWPHSTRQFDDGAVWRKQAVGVGDIASG